MKYILFAVFLGFFKITNSQSLHVGLNTSTNLTLTIGGSGVKFWRFPQDTDVIYSKQKVRRTPGVGFAIGPSIFYESKDKGKIRFVFEGIIAYNLTRYKVNWTVPYQSVTETGNAHIFYGVTRHESSIVFLPGLNYKQWLFQAGVSFLFTLKSSTTVSFLRGNKEYVNETSSNPEIVKSIGNKIMNLSVPFLIAYNFQIIHPFSIQPYLAYDLGVFNFDGYGLGNSSTRAISVLSKLELGAKFLIQTKRVNR